MLRNNAAPSIAPPPSRPTAVATPAQTAVRQQYLELRASVHRKLLGRLNLEALAHVERAKAEVEIRQLLVQLAAAIGTVAWTAAATWALLKLVAAITPLRVDEAQERQGLDIALHEESGYRF